MSYGCAIISTPVGGIPEIIFPNLNGILVQPGNEDEIYQSIKYFIQNKNKINEYGFKNKDLVKPFLSNAVMEQLNKIYITFL
jgi:glycosyltransferase involved in cell wall biosynthesis